MKMPEKIYTFALDDHEAARLFREGWRSCQMPPEVERDHGILMEATIEEQPSLWIVGGISVATTILILAVGWFLRDLFG